VGKGTTGDRIHRLARSAEERVAELEERVRKLLVEVGNRALYGTHEVVTGTVLADSGPAIGLVATQITWSSGIVIDYTYQADGFTVDTMTRTLPDLDPETYQANYAPSGVFTGYTPT
jgi:hypothetical protein